MKKISLTFIALVFAIHFSYAQWTGAPGNIYYNTGFVGIGTSSPSAALQIGDFASGAASNQLVIPGTYNFEQIRLGQLGNGNSALEFVNHTSFAPSYGIRFLVDVDHGAPGLQIQYAAPTTSYASLSYVTGLYLNTSGNIGIGTTDPGSYKLGVNGTIHSKAVVVDLTGWSDYVFKKDFKLMPLAEVKSYIDENQRLPGFPSEKEVIEKGLDVGEMNKLLTKKVEELTLYLIEKDREIKKQQGINNQQKAINRSLREQQKKMAEQLAELVAKVKNK